MALFNFKSQCPKCVEKGGDRSKDNLANYSDGGKHCFSCGYHVHGDEAYIPSEEDEVLDDIKEMSDESKERIKQGTTHKVTWRGIRPETNKFFGVVYECSQETGLPIKQFVPTTIDGGHVGYKTRVFPKDFSHPVGEVGKQCDLIGSFRFPNGGKYVVICAGEVDFLSAFQMLRDYQISRGSDEKYDPIACVTPTVGESGCGKQLQGNYKFLDSFERIVICFDSDAAGKAAVEKITPLLPRGKVYIMTPRYKDCNDYLTKGKEREFVTDFYNAKKHTPAGIVASTEIYKEVVQRSLLERLPFPPFLEKLNKMLSGGITYGFIVNILAGSGSGKCHGKGQEILMSDLSKKLVEDIVVGDKVMGADGNPRNVLATHSGLDMIYKVTPNKGMPYTVNSEHLIVLESNRRLPQRNIEVNKRFTMSAKDFYDLPSCYKNHNIYGVKADLKSLGDYCVEDAYILGLWLAEGTSSKPQFTLGKKDMVLHEILLSFAESKGYGVNTSPSGDRVGSKSYDLSGGMLVKLRDEWCVLNNKHIPKKFMLADYNTRLEVLAGFLDGDGYLGQGCFEMTLKKNQLADDIVLLARSLGLTVSQKDKFCKCQNFDGAWYSRIFISGGADKIPNRLPRKKANNTPNKNTQRVSLSIVEQGIGEYYGFEVDGDNMYCLPDMQITHNSSLINQCVIHWAKECNILTSVVSLEADSAAYGENLLSCYAGKKLALISNKEEKHSVVTSEYMENCAKELFSYEDGSPRMYILDDRGDYTDLQSKVEELITSFGVKVIVFDVISDVFAGLSIEEVDKQMKWQKNIVKQYNCILINISHTRKSGGGQKAASQGAFLTEEATIGSGTQYRSAGINISLQRDKTAEDDVERNTTQVYLLKSRDTGVTGLACEIFYENETHTLYDKEYYFSQIKKPTF